eukprot:scaffold143201_cov36-Prasinocladus_malaysianus.AAC.1
MMRPGFFGACSYGLLIDRSVLAGAGPPQPSSKVLRSWWTTSQAGAAPSACRRLAGVQPRHPVATSSAVLAPLTISSLAPGFLKEPAGIPCASSPSPNYGICSVSGDLLCAPMSPLAELYAPAGGLCRGCICEWCNQKLECPLCRSAISTTTLVPVLHAGF